jgi:hypothetical protein
MNEVLEEMSSNETKKYAKAVAGAVECDREKRIDKDKSIPESTSSVSGTSTVRHVLLANSTCRLTFFIVDDVTVVALKQIYATTPAEPSYAAPSLPVHSWSSPLNTMVRIDLCMLGWSVCLCPVCICVRQCRIFTT